MAVEPALTVAKQLLDLVVADPVVLLIIEDRDEHVQVRQQVAQSARRSQRDGEQPARAERRHALVECVTRRFDLVAERLEQRAEERLAAAAGDGREPSFERHRIAASSGFRSHRPASAELNQRESTTERSDDATYGRSLTYWSSAPPLPPRPRTMPTGSTSSSTAAVQPRRWLRDRRPSRGRTGTRACGRARVLVQQESEIGGRLMGCSYGQEHVLYCRDSDSPVYRAVRYVKAFV